jgi:selenophosphate synthetase-related protein
MLLEGSGCGAELDLACLPTPGPEAGWSGWQTPGAAAHAARLRWLSAFPSFGHVLAVAPAQVAPVQARFAAHGIACAEVGACVPGTRLAVRCGDGALLTLWDVAAHGFVHPVQPAPSPTRATQEMHHVP